MNTQKTTEDKIPLPTKPQEWDGGVPPVGVECEYAIASQNYQTGCFVGIKSSGSYVIETLHGDLRSYHPHQVQFRPLKSKQERQREELAELVRTAYLEGASDHAGGLSAVVDALIADGWKKEPKP